MELIRCFVYYPKEGIRWARPSPPRELSFSVLVLYTPQEPTLCLYYSYNTTSFNLYPLADPDSATTACTNDASKEPMRLCFLRIMLNSMI